MASSLTNDEIMLLDDIITEGLGLPIEKAADGKWMATVLGTTEKKALERDAGFPEDKWAKITQNDFVLACDIQPGEADANNAKTRNIIRSSSTQHPLFLHDDGFYYDCHGYRLIEQPPLPNKATGERVDSVARVATAMIRESAINVDSKKAKGIAETFTVTSPNFYDYSNLAEYAQDCSFFDAEFGGPAVAEGRRMIGTMRPGAEKFLLNQASAPSANASSAPRAGAAAGNTAVAARNGDAYYYDYDAEFGAYYSDVYYDYNGGYYYDF